jgi:histidyl-tRNA synthetase
MSTFSTMDFLKMAHRTAHHFGFVPLEKLLSGPRGADAPSQKASMADRKLDATGGMLTAGVSAYFERGLQTSAPSFFFSTYALPRGNAVAFTFAIVGVKKSIAESFLIQTLRSLARDLSYSEHSVRINTLGDQESVTRYVRELTSYFRKRLEDMPPEARDLMQEDVMAAYLYLMQAGHEICTKSPSPLEYLSDASRKHFREIVEHLDMTGTPYEIDPRFIGHHRCYSDTLFSLELKRAETDPPQPSVSVRGGRLDAFVKHVFKIDVPATGATLIVSGKKPARMPRGARSKPSIFMVQLGFGPKIRSLILLDMLKSADIPVHQLLASDSLGEQLRQAETYKVPFSIILGQKEFVENSIIVRDMRSRSQQSIPFDALIPHLKRILKKV